MIYENFAYLYDELMDDAPYGQWVEYFENQLKQYGNGGTKILDVGCGTGSVSIPLALKNYDVTGVDISTDMLTAAKQKAEEQCAVISFFQQDMKMLEGLGLFDVIIVFCDSLNYLQSEAEVHQAFQSFYNHLEPDGLLLFDVHSLFKINKIFMNQTFGSNEEHLSFVWQCFQGDTSNSVIHELTFFVLDQKTGLYQRYDEIHEQRTYPTETYSTWLEKCGFNILSITADFSSTVPNEESERIFFSVMKNHAGESP